MRRPLVRFAFLPDPGRLRLRRAGRGGSLLDALLALLLFSIGMLGLLRLMSSTLVEAANAQHRSQASQLASTLVARMWTGDRSVAALQARYGDTASADYQAWLAGVTARLPGTQAAALQPEVSIDAQRRIRITLHWQAPSDRRAHQLQVQAMITD